MSIGKHLATIFNDPRYIPENERNKIEQIRDIPIMICEDGSICCIPKEEEVSAMAFVGTSGFGKSLLFHRVIEHLFYLFGDKVAVMFDVSEETYKWKEIMKTESFNEFNKQSVNQIPFSLPMVYLFPNTSTLKLSEELLKKIGNYSRISLPFQEIIDNIGFYLSGVNPDFKLDRSGMYVNNLKEDLEHCSNQTEIKEILNEKLPGGKGAREFAAMRIKIFSAFESLFKEEILNVTNPEYPAYLKYGDFISNPISTIMKVGAIPSLITSDINIKKYKSVLISHYINSILRSKREEFPNDRIWLAFDELWELCPDAKEPASEAIGSISARGRIMDIGLLYCTQFYDKIPNSIKGAKLNYLFCFQTTDDRLREIASDFDLSPLVKSRIKNLKKFECVAMTRNKFVFYKGKEKWESSMPVFGSILFPLSGHRVAGEKI